MSSTRYWFEAFGELNSVRGDYEYVSDLCAAIHKKLGKASPSAMNVKIIVPSNNTTDSTTYLRCDEVVSRVIPTSCTSSLTPLRVELVDFQRGGGQNRTNSGNASRRQNMSFMPSRPHRHVDASSASTSYDNDATTLENVRKQMDQELSEFIQVARQSPSDPTTSQFVSTLVANLRTMTEQVRTVSRSPTKVSRPTTAPHRNPITGYTNSASEDTQTNPSDSELAFQASPHSCVIEAIIQRNPTSTKIVNIPITLQHGKRIRSVAVRDHVLHEIYKGIGLQKDHYEILYYDHGFDEFSKLDPSSCAIFLEYVSSLPHTKILVRCKVSNLGPTPIMASTTTPLSPAEKRRQQRIEEEKGRDEFEQYAKQFRKALREDNKRQQVIHELENLKGQAVLSENVARTRIIEKESSERIELSVMHYQFLHNARQRKARSHRSKHRVHNVETTSQSDSDYRWRRDVGSLEVYEAPLKSGVRSNLISPPYDSRHTMETIAKPEPKHEEAPKPAEPKHEEAPKPAEPKHEEA
eukprot:PhF_6_TR15661/c0_g1_i1/m.24336